MFQLGIGIKDILDIIIVACLLFYLYKIMKESGTINLFYGILTFIVVWVVLAQILEMKLIGSILDKMMSVGLITLVIIFQDQIKRFLIDIGSKKRWKLLRRLFIHSKTDKVDPWVMPIVYACLNMAKTKTGALIVIQQRMKLESYEMSGEIINADVNSQLIENIFFKNSPLHDGAMIIADGKIKAAACILPVSHNLDVPKAFGLRHRSALGISQETDALAIIVSEETGNISIAHKGKFDIKLSGVELENYLSHLE